MAKWYEIVREIDEIVTADCESGECNWRDYADADQYAHDYADGSYYVIYTHASREAWVSGADEWEDEAKDLGPFEDIQEWITATVYCAIHATVMDAVDAYRKDHEDDEEADDE